MKIEGVHDGVEAGAMEEREDLAVESGVDEDGLSTVLLHLAEIALSESREVGVSVLNERTVGVAEHSAQMVHVLHGDHIAAIHYQHLDGRQIVPALPRLDLLQRQRRRDDPVAVVEVRVQPQRAPSEGNAHTEAVCEESPRSSAYRRCSRGNRSSSRAGGPRCRRARRRIPRRTWTCRRR